MNKDSQSSIFETTSENSEFTPVKPDIPLGSFLEDNRASTIIKAIETKTKNSALKSISTEDTASKERNDLNIKRGFNELDGILREFMIQLQRFIENGGFKTMCPIFPYDRFTLIEDVRIILEVAKSAKDEKSKYFLKNIKEAPFNNRTIDAYKDRYKKYLVYLDQSDLERIRDYLHCNNYVGFMHFKIDDDGTRKLDYISRSRTNQETRKKRIHIKALRIFNRYRGIKVDKCICKLRHIRELSDKTQDFSSVLPFSEKKVRIPEIDDSMIIHASKNFYQDQYRNIHLDDLRFVASNEMKFINNEYFPEASQLKILKKYEFVYDLGIKHIKAIASKFHTFQELVDYLENEKESSANAPEWKDDKNLSPNSKTKKLISKTKKIRK